MDTGGVEQRHGRVALAPNRPIPVHAADQTGGRIDCFFFGMSKSAYLPFLGK